MAHEDSTSREPPLTFERILEDEYRFLHGPAPSSGGAPATSPATAAAGDTALAVHAAAGHSALCLSGGGVRSASFSLGVLEGLARAGVLDRFDYLSTVSGGGYVGGWLTAWRTRASLDGDGEPARQMAAAAGRESPGPLLRLRNSIRFLDPHLGFRSLDVWTLGTTILRNLLLNWLVLVPLLAAAALLPRLYLGMLGLPSQPELVSRETLAAWWRHDWLVSFPLYAVAALYAAVELPSLGNRGHGQRRFIACFVLPIAAAETIVSIHRYWAWRFDGGFALQTAVLAGTVGMALPWIGGALLSPRWWRPWTWLAAAAAGAAGRTIIWLVNHSLTDMARDHPEIFAVTDIPITLALLFLQMTLFAGLGSRDMTDDDREWWARAAAAVLMGAVLWLGGGALVIYAPIAIDAAFSMAGVSEGARRTWLIAVALVTSGAMSRLTMAWASSGRSIVGRLFMMAAAPLLVALFLVMLAIADVRLLEYTHGLDLFHEIARHPIGASLPEDLLVLGTLLAAGWIAGRLISVDAFSLHGLYRQRIARTFLGTSREPGSRHPNAFTGFDGHDDVPLHVAAVAGRPLHVLNATLNLVDETSLAMQEQRSESYTMSALHCGSRRVGYRPSAIYAGGISLSECMTVSGAAVSPNMGAASKPALTFLLALFNARLGAWLANPGGPGDSVWRVPRLAYSAAPLVDELLGRTSDASPYVYLSDGGHFENLGLYEMVLRRCRLIVVSDSGCDPHYRFDDLANAIRKIRMDFGIDIEFEEGLGIAGTGGRCRARSAIGRDPYAAAGVAAFDGTLLYVKAALCGDEPVDVAAYAAAHPEFPHQPTTNQWFDDAEFESYRMLGLHSIETIAGGSGLASIADLFEPGA